MQKAGRQEEFLLVASGGEFLIPGISLLGPHEGSPSEQRHDSILLGSNLRWASWAVLEWETSGFNTRDDSILGNAVEGSAISLDRKAK